MFKASSFLHVTRFDSVNMQISPSCQRVTSRVYLSVLYLLSLEMSCQHWWLHGPHILVNDSYSGSALVVQSVNQSFFQRGCNSKILHPEALKQQKTSTMSQNELILSKQQCFPRPGIVFPSESKPLKCAWHFFIVWNIPWYMKQEPKIKN